MNKNHIQGRLEVGEFAKQSPTLPEAPTVNAADIWDEGYRSYPGRSHGHAFRCISKQD